MFSFLFRLPLKDELSALEDEFDFEDVSQSKLTDYPLTSGWKDNQELHAALPEIYCLEEKYPAIPIWHYDPARTISRQSFVSSAAGYAFKQQKSGFKIGSFVQTILQILTVA